MTLEQKAASALDWLESRRAADLPLLSRQEADAIGWLREAAKKQIPKEAERAEDSSSGAWCPGCGASVWTGQRCCGSCGQRLRWRAEDAEAAAEETEDAISFLKTAGELLHRELRDDIHDDGINGGIRALEMLAGMSGNG